MSQQLTMFATEPSSSHLIGLTIRLDRPADRERPCCDNLVNIDSNKGKHYASLTCACCGRHRGWLAAAAITFISKSVQHFGSIAEPIVLRTPLPEKETTMAKDARQNREYDNTNRGALFKNKKKEGDRDPDFTGQVNVDGTEYWASAWVNVSKAGDKYVSLSVKPKDDKSKDRSRDKVAQSDDVFGLD
jgi:hypothetical protein